MVVRRHAEMPAPTRCLRCLFTSLTHNSACSLLRSLGREKHAPNYSSHLSQRGSICEELGASPSSTAAANQYGCPFTPILLAQLLDEQTVKQEGMNAG